jgi:hypothetical protein
MLDLNFLKQNHQILEYTENKIIEVFNLLNPKLTFYNCRLEISYLYTTDFNLGAFGSGITTIYVYNVIDSAVEIMDSVFTVNGYINQETIYKIINSLVYSAVVHELCHSKQLMLNICRDDIYMAHIENENEIETKYQLNNLIGNGVISIDEIDMNIINFINKATIPENYSGYDHSINGVHWLLYKILQYDKEEYFEHAISGEFGMIDCDILKRIDDVLKSGAKINIKLYNEETQKLYHACLNPEEKDVIDYNALAYLIDGYNSMDFYSAEIYTKLATAFFIGFHIYDVSLSIQPTKRFPIGSIY